MRNHHHVLLIPNEGADWTVGYGGPPHHMKRCCFPSSNREPSAARQRKGRVRKTYMVPRLMRANQSVSATRRSSTAPWGRPAAGDDVDAAAEQTNINVVVRCRGRNQREVKENSAVVVTAADGVKGESVELSMGASALNKTYRFDRVFSSAADQNMIFDDTVKPILDEVRRLSLLSIPCSRAP